MIATTRAALLRGSEQDILGDEVETNDVDAQWNDFAISIIEGETREFDPASNTWRTIRTYAARLSPAIPVVAGDRIRDNVTGVVYAIDKIKSARRGLAGRSSATLRLRRTTP